MKRKNFQYIYGPVSSWRLGRSLGVDPLSGEDKICNFDCTYCQLGSGGEYRKERADFVPTAGIIDEINALPPVALDYITFSGRGEPTLAANLGEMISEVKKTRKEPVAVLTNSTLLHDKEVAKSLYQADLIAVKIDASDGELFEKINRPAEWVEFNEMIEGIKYFRHNYKGRLALQVMFLEENREKADEIARLAGDIDPDEVQLNTPLRPCAARPLSKDTMDKIEIAFKGLDVITVYNSTKKTVQPVSKKDTMRRRGKC